MYILNISKVLLGTVALVSANFALAVASQPWKGSFHYYGDTYYDVGDNLVVAEYPEPWQVLGQGLSEWDEVDAIKCTSSAQDDFPLSDLNIAGA